jgi:hypothetical protein
MRENSISLLLRASAPLRENVFLFFGDWNKQFCCRANDAAGDAGFDGHHSGRAAAPEGDCIR